MTIVIPLLSRSHTDLLSIAAHRARGVGVPAICTGRGRFLLATLSVWSPGRVPRARPLSNLRIEILTINQNCILSEMKLIFYFDDSGCLFNIHRNSWPCKCT